MMTAIFSTAGSNVDFPTAAVLARSRRAAIPSGSRIRSISTANLAGAGVVSSQASPGRMTSPPISWTMPC